MPLLDLALSALAGPHHHQATRGRTRAQGATGRVTFKTQPMYRNPHPLAYRAGKELVGVVLGTEGQLG